jgi:hypothetical protein
MTMHLSWRARALWWKRVSVCGWRGTYRTGQVAWYGGYLSFEPDGVYFHRSQLRTIGAMPLMGTSIRLPGPEVTWVAIEDRPPVADRAGILFEGRRISRLALIDPADRDEVRSMLINAGLAIVEATFEPC